MELRTRMKGIKRQKRIKRIKTEKSDLKRLRRNGHLRQRTISREWMHKGESDENGSRVNAVRWVAGTDREPQSDWTSRDDRVNGVKRAEAETNKGVNAATGRPTISPGMWTLGRKTSKIGNGICKFAKCKNGECIKYVRPLTIYTDGVNVTLAAPDL